MSLVALILNLTLGVLLVAALALGWRLERRLRALRDSHQSFAKAVDDLDRAASRAEQGLADLRAATDEAAESLAGRIEKAKALAARLDTVGERSGAAPAAHPLRVRDIRNDLILEDEARAALRAPPPPLRGERPFPGPAAPAPAPRSRARIDDDLFEDGPARGPAPARGALGGRR